MCPFLQFGLLNGDERNQEVIMLIVRAVNNIDRTSEAPIFAYG